MKYLKVKTLFLTILAVGIFGFVSCDKFDNPVDDSDYTPTKVVLYDVNEINLQEGNLDQPITCEPILPMGVDRLDNRKGPDRKKDEKRPGIGFEEIFRLMALTPEQYEVIKAYFSEHRDCVSSWLKKLRDAQMEIIAAAREEQKSIIAKYKAGEITREEAALALRELNLKTKEALRNLTVNEDVRKGIKDCFDELIANIKSELTPEQLTMFERWLASKNGTIRNIG